MQTLRLIHALVRRLNDWLAKLAMAIGMAVIGFAALALFVQALERHTTGQGYAWLNDFPPFLVPWCVFPLMGALLRGDRHVAVEVAPTMLRGAAGRVLSLLIGLICLAAGLYFCWAGSSAVSFFAMLGQVTETEIRIPFWWLYAAFPVGFGMFALFALERVLWETLALATGPVPEAGR